MRKIAWILCFALVLSLFAGCSDEKEAYVPTGDALDDATMATQAPPPGQLEAEGNAYTLGYFAKDGFNPYDVTGYTNRHLFSLLYQGLFSVDGDYNVEPMLCKTYTMSEDMKTYTFRLEPAIFSDGTYIDAEDVVASLETAEDSDFYEGRFRFIGDIEALNETTVKISLLTPMENLPILLDIPIVKAENVGDMMPSGTGPYRLVRTVSGLTLQRKANWWCTTENLAVTAQAIVLRSAESPAKIRDWFEFEDVGIAYADPGSGTYAEYRCDYEVWDCETGIMTFLACHEESKVFSNPQVRAALTYAINREVLVESNYNGFAQAATLPASPNSPYYDKTLAAQVTYNPERLIQALTESNLTGETVILLLNKSDSTRLQTGYQIAEMLTQCGLVVEIQEMSTNMFRNSVYAGNYDLYLGQTQLSANMDLSEFFHPYGYISWGSMSNEDLYALCLNALENSGNYYNLHQMVVQDGMLTPVLFRTYAVYMERGLMGGLNPARDNVYWYSIGKNMEDAMTIVVDEE